MKRNARAFEVAEYKDLHKAGAYQFWPDRTGIHFGCPCGCGTIGGIEFKRVGLNGWEIFGTWPNATARPSIGFSGDWDSPKRSDGYHWHGYITDGMFEELESEQ
jgi:Family of unknown function (DUF6527)